MNVVTGGTSIAVPPPMEPVKAAIAPAAAPTSGLLLRLIDSDLFDTFMAVSYLYKYRFDKKWMGVICNKLYHLPEEEIEFYLFQLVHMYVSFDAVHPDYLLKFLVDKSSTSVHFSLKVMFMCNAYIGRESSTIFSQRASELHDMAESAAVNISKTRRMPHRAWAFTGRLSKKVDASSTGETSGSDTSISDHSLPATPEASPAQDYDRTQHEFNAVVEKQSRWEMLNGSFVFLNELVRLSNTLATIPRENRLAAMRAEVAKMNVDRLPTNIAYIPLYTFKQKHHHILRIAIDECLVLSSRTRAPIMLFVEIVERSSQRVSAVMDPHGHFDDKTWRRVQEIKREVEDETQATLKRLLSANKLPRNKSLLGDEISRPSSRMSLSSLADSESSRTASPALSRSGRSTSEPPAVPTKTPELHSTPFVRGAPSPDSAGDAPRMTEVRPAKAAAAAEDVQSNNGNGETVKQTEQPSAQPSTQPSKSTNDKTAVTDLIDMAAQVQIEEQPLPSITVETQTSSPPAETVDAGTSTADGGSTIETAPNDIENRPPECSVSSEIGVGTQSDSEHGIAPARQSCETPRSPSLLERAVTTGCVPGVPRDIEKLKLWRSKELRVSRASPYSAIHGWRMLSFIVKSGDDLRQEYLAQQCVAQVYNILHGARLPLWLNPYRILICSQNSGLIETIPGAVSIDSLKKAFAPDVVSLKYVLEKRYGKSPAPHFIKAQQSFAESLAGYSLLCYILQVKDRHNGNILLDEDGHLIHIDFGFMLSNSPGSISFESAPFKLTPEMVDALGGLHSDMFVYFKMLLLKGFLEVCKHSERLIVLIEMLMKGTDIPCLGTGSAVISELRSRLRPSYTEDQALALVEELVAESLGSWTTSMYDQFQYLTNGIL